MNMKKIVYFAIIFILNLHLFGQDNYRLKADFTIKIKGSEGNKNFTKGKVYYDKNYKQLIYDVSFPDDEKWVLIDTILLKMKKGSKIPEKSKILSVNNFTVFHLALNSELTDFGLKNTVYRISKIEKKGDLVLTYWNIPANNLKMDYIIIAKKNNQLFSLAMVNEKGEIFNQQFFRNYIKIKSFEFPTEVVQIIYNQLRKKTYQVYEFKNIEINELQNDQLYKFKYN